MYTGPLTQPQPTQPTPPGTSPSIFYPLNGRAVYIQSYPQASLIGPLSARMRLDAAQPLVAR